MTGPGSPSPSNPGRGGADPGRAGWPPLPELIIAGSSACLPASSRIRTTSSVAPV